MQARLGRAGRLRFGACPCEATVGAVRRAAVLLALALISIAVIRSPIRSSVQKSAPQAVELGDYPNAAAALGTPGNPRPASAATAASIADLVRRFRSPPDDSRIMMRWWWFGPAVTRPEIERELRVMRDAGIGGVEIQPVYPLALDDPAKGIRNLPFLSDDFLDALRFAADVGRRLGLRVDLTLGSGWPYGGPTVPITDAAGKLRIERVKVPPGTRRAPVPSLTAGEALIVAFLADTALDAVGGMASPTRQIADADIRDGVVHLQTNLTGTHDLLFFIASRTGMMVKRPAVGAEGFVLDHYDRGATERYLASVGDRLLRAFPPAPPYAVFCDSLEVYESDWTGDFLEVFQKRRGYDLRPHLPALAIDLGRQSEGIRHDWGRTLTELLRDRFLAPVHEWARSRHTRFRLQGYGTPPASLSSNEEADLAEGEGWQWTMLRPSRWASSANHLYGRPVTSSETWTWLHSPVFRATPLDLKAEADLHFLQGINQIVGHGWPYTAEGVEYPGWRFYAAGAFDEKNPWWIVMPDLAAYLQRVSFMLRQGRPANDVALYLPTSDAWAHFSPGHVHLIETLRERVGPDVIPQVLQAGFNLDLVDDDVLARHGRIERGTGQAQGPLAIGSGRYRVVILPGVEQIPAATLELLDAFVQSGGVLVATRRLPELAPGFLATERDHVHVREIIRRLFHGPAARAHFVEDEAHALAGALARLVQPDVALSPAGDQPSMPTTGFVHRRTDDADVYFLVNTSNSAQRLTASFRRGYRGTFDAEWWDPLTGERVPAVVKAAGSTAVGTTLELEPYASRFLVLADASPSVPPAGPVGAASRASTVTPLPASTDVSADWSVSFGGSAPVHMSQLRSWTEGEATRDYSGLATYEKEINPPEALFQEGLAVRLDFGEPRAVPVTGRVNGFQAWLEAPVREAAVVYVNDRRAGSIWCPPYSLDITRLLRRGPNHLKIVVGNLAINHMAARALPSYRFLNLRYGVRFEPQDMEKVQPVASGLMGPIRLVPMRRPPEEPTPRRSATRRAARDRTPCMDCRSAGGRESNRFGLSPD